MIGACLDWLARRYTIMLAVGVLIGLAVPTLAALFRPLLVPCIILIVALSLVRLDVGAVMAHVRRPGLVAATLLFLLVVAPAFAALALLPLTVIPAVEIGVVLLAAAPPIMSAPALCLMLGLDAAFAALVMVLSYALTPFTLPAVSLWLLGLDIGIGAWALMGRLGLVIGAAFALAVLLRATVLPTRVLASWSRRIDGILVVGLVVFVIAVMDGVTALVLERPGYALRLTVVSVVANALLQLVGAVLFLPAGRPIALAVALMSGNTNLGLVLAALAARAEFDVLVFFALGQLPIYMLPLATVPLYRRLMRGNRP